MAEATKLSEIYWWEALKLYYSGMALIILLVGSESIAVGECVLIRRDSADEVVVDEFEQWKARVLEVRAFDSEHVFLRVAWLNRPEDLTCGRQQHHGLYELIPTNEMDIINAMTVNGRIDVINCNGGDVAAAIESEEYFWRQTLDFTSKKLSVIHRIAEGELR